MTRLLKPEWLPRCRMDRLILHWTAGTYEPSLVEEHHYHFLVKGDGTVVRGKPISANVPPLRGGVYAAHTRGCNSYSIGVAVCCMKDAREKPFDSGPYPMKREQWEVMAQAAAELCTFYKIPVTPETVLGHGEVERVLKIKQRGKWDPMVWPWDPEEKEPMGQLRYAVGGCK